MSAIQIHTLAGSDVEPALEFVMRVFNEFVAPDCRPDGITSFTAWANPAALTGRLDAGSVALVAIRPADDGRIVGLIEWMPPDHLAMLFVDPAVQGEGIGRRLFDEALGHVRAAHGDIEAVEVHASRYAVAFYRRLGFREKGPERIHDGILFTPMRLELTR